MEIIGRLPEQKILKELLTSGEAELVAVYGRRRVGKTYLIRNYFEPNMVFEFTGMHGASLSDQLYNFSNAIQQAMGIVIPPATPNNWMQAFTFLTDFLKTKLKKKPVVILLDEFPWIHTPKSKFLDAFGHWWNTWASLQPQLKVVICGSAASWMIENILNNKGGLHNRVSKTIRLLPFTLYETEKYLKSRNIQLDQYQVLQLYMAMGGIPQYLKQIHKGESAIQAIDKMFFTQNGLLKNEFGNLYRSLFNNAAQHEAIVRALARKPSGLNRTELMTVTGFTTGGGTTRLLNELEQSGFISQYIPFGKTSRDSIYKLTDEYSLFFMKFVERAKSAGKGSWQKIAAGQPYKTWSGFAFETVCQKHQSQILKALGIAGVYTETTAWRHVSKTKEATGVQIDLLIDRQDHCINLCEIKFSSGQFVIDKKYAAVLDNKIAVFQEQTKTAKTIFPTMITTYGTAKNDYYTGRIQAAVTMKDLFKS